MATNQSYCSLILIDNDSLECEIKTEDVYEDFSSDKKCLILAIIPLMMQTN